MAHEILIGVSGGVAAYKTAALVSSLVQRGHSVQVVMTASARRFIGAATFEALSGRPVPRGGFDMHDHPLGPHIELAERAELVCVAPATANLLAKAASGLADDLLCTLLLCFSGPVFYAPAMNSQMYAKPSVARNLETLRGDGAQIIAPGEGWLSCRQQGPGRMAEPQEIQEVLERALAQQS